MITDEELIKMILAHSRNTIEDDPMTMMAEEIYERHLIKRAMPCDCWLKWVGLVYAQHGLFTENFQTAYFGKIFKQGGLEDIGF